jgi:uncharacterized membrane protein
MDRIDDDEFGYQHVQPISVGSSNIQRPLYKQTDICHFEPFCQGFEKEGEICSKGKEGNGNGVVTAKNRGRGHKNGFFITKPLINFFFFCKMKFIMNFLLIVFFLAMIVVFFYSIFEKKWQEYKDANREGFSSSNTLRAAAIEYYLENIPNMIPQADYRIISDNIKNMQNTITEMNTNSPVTEKNFDILKNKFQININEIYNKLENTNSILKINSGLTQMIDSLNNNFTLDANKNY